MIEDISKNEWYHKMRPYEDEEFRQGIERLSKSEGMIRGIQYFYPEWNQEYIVERLLSCDNSDDFQVKFFKEALKRIIKKSSSGFSSSGLETLDPQGSYLFLSSHRDILLDSAFLQMMLHDAGLPFTEISLGSNLMMSQDLIDFAKINKMYNTLREGSPREMIEASRRMSAYLRYTIGVKQKSAWLAQNKGRTKDGYDRVEPGILKMLSMSSDLSLKENLKEFNMVVETVSYEYEPCDLEKAVETYSIRSSGTYTKKPFEDWHNITQGVKEFKGKIHFACELLNLDEINYTGNKNEDINSICRKIEEINTKNYRLHSVHFIAYDLLHNDREFSDQYSAGEKEEFIGYLNKKTESLKGQSDETIKAVQKEMIIQYANPVNKKYNREKQ